MPHRRHRYPSNGKQKKKRRQKEQRKKGETKLILKIEKDKTLRFMNLNIQGMKQTEKRIRIERYMKAKEIKLPLDQIDVHDLKSLKQWYQCLISENSPGKHGKLDMEKYR